MSNFYLLFDQLGWEQCQWGDADCFLGDTTRVHVRAANCEGRTASPWLPRELGGSDDTFHCHVLDYVLVDASSVWNDEVRLVCRRLEGVLVEEESGPSRLFEMPSKMKALQQVDS